MDAQNRLEAFRSARRLAFGDTPARRRMAMLFDPDTFVELDGFVEVDGQPGGVVCGWGAVMGSPVYAFSQDITQGHGAVGALHAAKIRKLYDLALKTGAPVVGIYDSSGARVSEGVGALEAYGEILLRVNSLSGVVPQIALVAGTCAGASALLACSSDFVVMSGKGELFLTPPAFSKDAQGAGSAENAAKAGVAHIVEPDEESACAAVRRLISVLPINNLASPPVLEYAEPADATAMLEAAAVNISDQDPAGMAEAILDAGSLQELMTDFGKQVFTAIGTLGGTAVGVVGTRPGMLDRDSSACAAKLVSICDAYQIPVLTLVNSTGFEASAQAELCGAVRDMARLAHVYAEATTPKFSVITGQAIGAAYIALCSRSANADYTCAWPAAVLSTLSPTASVAFLYGDEISADRPREAVEADYIETHASPVAAAKAGYLDDVIEPGETRSRLLAALDLLSAKRVARNPKKHSNLPL